MEELKSEVKNINKKIDKLEEEIALTGVDILDKISEVIEMILDKRFDELNIKITSNSLEILRLKKKMLLLKCIHIPDDEIELK